MRIVATALFERLVHMAHCTDPSSPGSPKLEIDAVVRPGDLDGPVLLTLAMFRAFCSPGTDQAAVVHLRDCGRITSHDGVAHVVFPTWTVGPNAVLLDQRPCP